MQACPPEISVMKTEQTKDEWPVVGENDPPPDLSREEAAYQRERERLGRDHLGKIALIRFDESPIRLGPNDLPRDHRVGRIGVHSARGCESSILPAVGLTRPRTPFSFPSLPSFLSFPNSVWERRFAKLRFASWAPRHETKLR